MTARKVRISDLVSGKFFYGSKEEMKPSYVITPYGGKVSRVSIVGTVTEKFTNEEGSYSSVTLDDGTGAIKVKSFERGLESLEAGDIVRVIGKLKEYNGELYIAFEIASKEKMNAELLGRLDVLHELAKQKKVIDDVRAASGQMDEEELKNYAKDTYGMDGETLGAVLEAKKKEVDYRPKVLEIIEKLDEGNGIEAVKLFDVLNLPDNIVEKTIDQLLNDGSIYEPKIGHLKKV